MASTTAVIQHAWLKMRSLQSWYLSLFDPMPGVLSRRLTVTYELAHQLTWWMFLPHLLVGRPFLLLQLTIQVSTDTSPSGWGPHCQYHRIYGLWTRQEQLIHISHFKLLAVIKVFLTFLPIIAWQAVELATDNTTALYYVNKQGGTLSLSCLLYTSPSPRD